MTEAVTDGVSVNLTNEFSSDYKDVVVTKMNAQKVNDYATLRVYYGENGKGVKNENIILNYTYGSDSKLTKPATLVKRTDDNGVAYIDVPQNFVRGSGTQPVDKVSYTITTERDKKIVKEGTFSFATINTSNVDNVNGEKAYQALGKAEKVDYVAKGYKDLVVSENDTDGTTKGNGLNWSAGTLTSQEADLAGSVDWLFARDYVTSQQVSLTGSDAHKVAFAGGLPYITLPSDTATLNSAKTFQQDVNLTASTENTYATEAQYITLKDVKPNELTYATLNVSGK